MIVYLVFFVILTLISLNYDAFQSSFKRQLWTFITVSLILFAGLRGSNVSFDDKSYLIYYNHTPTINFLFSNSKAFFNSIQIEPNLLLIFSFFKSNFINGFNIAIFVYAFLSVSLKMKAIKTMTDFYFLSLLIYFSGFFLVQDMTQIRAAVAVGILLLSIKQMEQKNFLKFYFLIMIAFFFHNSSILFIPFIALNSKRINKINYILIVLIPIILYLFRIDPINLFLNFNLGIFSDKIKGYILLQKYMNFKINLFNFNIILQIIVSLFFIFYSEKSNNKYAILLTKINCYGIALFFLFNAIPVIAFRSNEVLCSVQIILIPLFVYFIKPKYIPEGIVIIISILYLINQLFINPIINPYTSILFK